MNYVRKRWRRKEIKNKEKKEKWILIFVPLLKAVFGFDGIGRD